MPKFNPNRRETMSANEGRGCGNEGGDKGGCGNEGEMQKVPKVSVSINCSTNTVQECTYCTQYRKRDMQQM